MCKISMTHTSETLQAAQKHTPTLQKAASVHSTQDEQGEKRCGKHKAQSEDEYETLLLLFLEAERGVLLNITISFCACHSIFTQAEAFLGRCSLFLEYYVINKSKDATKQTQNEVFHHQMKMEKSVSRYKG